MGKIVIKFLLASAVTQTWLDGLTTNPPVASFLQFVCAKIYESLSVVYKVIAIIERVPLYGSHCRFTNIT